MVKADLSQEGLRIFFKDWEVPIIELLKSGKYDADNPLRSKEATTHANNQGFKISRTSVIFFLQDMVEEGWLTMEKRTGKGGYHETYWMTAPLEEIMIDIIEEFSIKLCEIVGQHQSLKGSTKNEV